MYVVYLGLLPTEHNTLITQMPRYRCYPEDAK